MPCFAGAERPHRDGRNARRATAKTRTDDAHGEAGLDVLASDCAEVLDRASLLNQPREPGASRPSTGLLRVMAVDPGAPEVVIRRTSIIGFMSSATSPVAGRVAAPGDRRWLVLIVVAVAQLMVVLDSTIVNIALPSAQRALGFPNSERQWVVTAYALAFGSLLLVGGRLGDMFSRERVFITGLIGFAGASAIGGASVSFTMLVAARALQGAFGAVLAPSALGTLVSTFREPRERARAFGVFGSVAAGGGAVGLILGGVLTQYVSWRWTLYVNLVFAAIAVAGALAWIRPSRPDARPRMDWPGAVLACAGLFLIVFGFSRGETAGWTAPQTLGSLAAGLVLLAGFVVAEQRSGHPLLPLRVILDRTRGGSYAAVFISGIAIFATFLFLTYYLQVIKAESPLATGLLFLPMVGCILISSNLSSIVGLARLGPRVLIATGMLLGAGGMAYLTRGG